MPITFEKCTHCKWLVIAGEGDWTRFYCTLAEREQWDNAPGRAPIDLWTLAMKRYNSRLVKKHHETKINEKFIVPAKCPYILEFTI